MEREDWDRRWRERGFHCEDDPSELLESELADLEPGRALDLARAADADVDWVLADLNGYEPEPGVFDLVLVLYVHVPAAERQTLLARAPSALAPGGTLLVAGHDLANLGTGAPGPSNPDVLYSPETIVGELGELDVKRAERVGDEAVDTVVVARTR